METFTSDTHYSILRRQIAPVLRTRIGGGASQLRRQYQRPIYEFTLKDSHAVKSSAEYIYGFARYHQQDIPFWWSGGPWGTVSTPILVGFGDGTRTQFFLPNRNVQGSGFIAYHDGTAYTLSDWDLDGPTGLVTFHSAPAANVKLTALYLCSYKVVFASDSEVLLNEENLYASLFSYQGIVIREVVP